MAKNETVEKLFGQLVEGVKGFYSSDTWKEFLIVQSKFHSYSFSNTVLIMMQLPYASRVAGFNAWKELGRNVKKGEKALKILAPLIGKKIDEDTQEEEKVIYGFKYVNVFDVSQTEGKALPSLCEELKGNDEALQEFYETAKTIIKIPVIEKEIQGGAKGYYHIEEDYIAVKKSASYEHKCKTLIHEYVHSILHSKEAERRDSLTQGEREIEAEGTSFVVCHYFGLDTSEYSFPYCASWNGSEKDIERIRKAGDIIQKTAHRIIEEIETARKDTNNKAA